MRSSPEVSMTGDKALISKIQRYSTKDGPGLRTTVFFMGCSLRCNWCANPETLSARPQVYYFKERCQHCGLCVQAGNEAISFDHVGCLIDRDHCQNLAEMVELCPFDAYETVGMWKSAEELAEILLKDQTFYESTGGGVTFSGGEAALQSTFVLHCAKLLKQHSIHICLDTAGYVSWEHLDALSDVVDLILYDIKAFDPLIHKRCTGYSNEKILDHFIRLAQKKVPMRVRMIVVPDQNDDVQDLKARIDFVAKHRDCVEQVDLLNYHIYGIGKYEKLGMIYPLADQRSAADDSLKWLLEYGEAKGLRMTIGG